MSGQSLRSISAWPQLATVPTSAKVGIMNSRAAAALLVTTAALAGCGGSASEGSEGNRLDVAVGFYPYEFVAAAVGGDDITVTNLTQPGGEPHDLELTPRQVAELAETDLVVYARGFQPAVDVAVEQQAAEQGFDVLTAVELREGDHGAHEGEAGDPHVWLDPMRLAAIGDAVAEELAERAPERADAFRDRAEDLRAELTALDEEMTAGLASCQRQEIVTSHDAFGYLAEAYGLEQVSIAGLSPEDEASPKRLAEVAAFAKESNVTTIFFEELVSPRVAESLAREVDAAATVLSPLEGAPETGDYLSAMRDNLERLRVALDCR